MVPGVLGNSNDDLTVLDLSFERLKAIENGTLIRLTSLDGKAGVVQRTHDFIAAKEALGQREAKMRTFALGGINSTVIFIDNDGVFFFRADLDFPHVSLLDVVGGLEGSDLVIENLFGA